jgi:hypothetical protein
VLERGKEFVSAGSLGLGSVTGDGRRLPAGEYNASVEWPEAGPLAGEIRLRGTYPIAADASRASPFTARMRFTRFSGLRGSNVPG